MRVHGGKRTVIAEINMIPLIDISLIILIIFMVITPYLVQSQIQVSLPRASAGTGDSTESPVKVQLSADGRLAVEGKVTPEDGLEKELLLRLGGAGAKTVLVEADRSVPVERVVRVFDVAKRLNAGKIGIAVSPETEKRQP